MDNDSAVNSIKAAFNLGVWMRQNEPGDYDGTVAEKEDGGYYAKTKAVGMN